MATDMCALALKWGAPEGRGGHETADQLGEEGSEASLST